MGVVAAVSLTRLFLTRRWSLVLTFLFVLALRLVYLRFFVCRLLAVVDQGRRRVVVDDVLVCCCLFVIIGSYSVGSFWGVLVVLIGWARGYGELGWCP